MAKQLINVGTAANDDLGDDLRVAFDKLNQNFEELFALIPDDGEGEDPEEPVIPPVPPELGTAGSWNKLYATKSDYRTSVVSERGEMWGLSYSTSGADARVSLDGGETVISAPILSNANISQVSLPMFVGGGAYWAARDSVGGSNVVIYQDDVSTSDYREVCTFSVYMPEFGISSVYVNPTNEDQISIVGGGNNSDGRKWTVSDDAYSAYSQVSQNQHLYIRALDFEGKFYVEKRLGINSNLQRVDVYCKNTYGDTDYILASLAGDPTYSASRWGWSATTGMDKFFQFYNYDGNEFIMYGGNDGSPAPYDVINSTLDTNAAQTSDCTKNGELVAGMNRNGNCFRYIVGTGVFEIDTIAGQTFAQANRNQFEQDNFIINLAGNIGFMPQHFNDPSDPSDYIIYTKDEVLSQAIGANDRYNILKSAAETAVQLKLHADGSPYAVATSQDWIDYANLLAPLLTLTDTEMGFKDNRWKVRRPR